METKPTPLTIVLTITALVVTIICGFLSVSTGIGRLYDEMFRDVLGGSSAQGLLVLIGRSIIYVLVPALAIIDISRHKSVGRYLALLTFVCSAAMLFRSFLDGALLPVRGRSVEGFTTMLCFALSMLALALIVGLAFTRDADPWFESPDESQNDLPAPMPIESLMPSLATSYIADMKKLQHECQYHLR